MPPGDPYFFPPDHAALLPMSLAPLAQALDLVAAYPDPARGWMARGYPHAPPWPLEPGAPPYDGVYRASWISPALCLRLDLMNGCVPASLGDLLRRRFPAQLGGDGALYEFGVRQPSQRGNREHVILQLAQKVLVVP